MDLIEVLDDDCLIEIFKFLPLEELYKVSKISKRCADIIKMFKQKYNFNTNHKLLKVSNTSSNNFFKIMGHHIERLTISLKDNINMNSTEFLEVLKYRCKNIKYLQIVYTDTVAHKRILLNLLREINIFQNLVAFGLHERELSTYPHFTTMLDSLEIIELNTSDSQSTLQNILNLKSLNGSGKLECLSLSSYTQNSKNIPTQEIRIDQDEFIVFLQNNLKLKHLSIMNQPQLFLDPKKYSQNSLMQSLANLTVLSLDADSTGFSNLTVFSKLPNLKCLNLIRYESQHTHIINALIQRLIEIDIITELQFVLCFLSETSLEKISKFSKLKVLKMIKNYVLPRYTLGKIESLEYFSCFDSMNVDDSNLLEFIRQNQNLKFLDISWCFSLSNTLLHGIDEYYKENSNLSKLDILIGGTSKIKNEKFIQDITKNNPKLNFIFNTEQPLSFDFISSTCKHCVNIEPCSLYNQVELYKKN